MTRTRQEFEKLCVTGLRRDYAEALAEQANFTTREWMDVYSHCSDMVPRQVHPYGRIPRCYNMQIVALKKAVTTAVTQEDWECIRRYARSGKQRTFARDKLLDLIHLR